MIRRDAKQFFFFFHFFSHRYICTAAATRASHDVHRVLISVDIIYCTIPIRSIVFCFNIHDSGSPPLALNFTLEHALSSSS